MNDQDHRFRVLLIGILAQTNEFDAAGALREMDSLVRRLVPSALVHRCFGRAQATRAGILAALDAWIEDTRPTDTCVLYYFGHGGRARFAGLGDELSKRVIPYLSCEGSGGGFTGILDHDLSTRVAELDCRCGNVTTIIDACFSGTVVRAGERASERAQPRNWSSVWELDAPAWVRRMYASPDERLAAESHPNVVRLAGASPRHQAFLTSAAEQLETRQGPPVGMFTRALVDAFNAAGDHWRQLSWDSLVHDIRRRVVRAFAMEGQWISMSGPRERLLFSTREAQLPRTVGYVETRQGHWIRAGSVQGVECGDRWALTDPLVGDDGRHGNLVEAEVVDVEHNRARISISDDARLRAAPLGPATAHPLAMKRRMPVDLAPDVELDLECTAWLQRGAGARNCIRRVDASLELVDTKNEWSPLRVTDNAAGRAQLVELLEDRARVERLLESVQSLDSELGARIPVTWAVGSGDAKLAAGAGVRADEGLWIELRNPADVGRHWYISTILVDPFGRGWLLNASQPDGVELEPDDLEYVGRRPGAARSGLRPEGEGRARVLVLAGGRPLQLGHLLRAMPNSESAAFRFQGTDPAHRGEPNPALDPLPEPSDDWCWGILDLNLLPSSTQLD